MHIFAISPCGSFLRPAEKNKQLEIVEAGSSKYVQIYKQNAKIEHSTNFLCQEESSRCRHEYSAVLVAFFWVTDVY
jgi:hypothetical protein